MLDAPTFCRVVPIDIKDPNGRLVAHTLLSDANDLSALIVECYRLDRSWELPGAKAFAR